jgi:uncharacterized protein
MPAKPPAKSPNQPEPSRKPAASLPGQQRTPTEVVDPRWLVKALALSALTAVVCAWLAVCLLVYQGEWQLVLHPAHTVDRTPASVGLAFEPVRFDAAETGQPRLTGWWIPAQASGAAAAPLELQFTPKYAGYTVLYLHDGWGSLANSVPMLASLHAVGLNIFAIDYRGFGASDASSHPTEAGMKEDTQASLDFLTTMHHLAPETIVPYGVGLGGSLAVNLAHAHPELPAVIVEDANPDPTATAVAAQPSHVIPIRLLFRERFEIAGPLATLATPKLLIAGGGTGADMATVRANQTLYLKAASPSISVTLTPKNFEASYRDAVTRFLDEYLSSSPGRNQGGPSH